MVKKLLLFCIVSFAFIEAEVLTYTAYSTKSQADADAIAVAGVAKQLSVQVKASSIYKQAEIQNEKDSHIGSFFLSEKNLSTDLELKGVRVIQGEKKGDTFSATAALDLDALTAVIAREMQKIQKEISSKETEATSLISEFRYQQALKILEDVKNLSKKYAVYIQEHEFYKPLPPALELKSQYSEIFNRIETELRDIKIDVNKNSDLQLQNNKPFVFKVTVKKKNKPVPDFSVYVSHKNKVLFEKNSDANGEILIEIPFDELTLKPFVIEILPTLSFRFSNFKNLGKQEVSYIYETKKCKIDVKCLEESSVCSAISEGLASNLGFSVNVVSNASLETKVVTESKRSLKQLSSYQVSLEFHKNGVFVSQSKTGVGKTEKDAVLSAIEKMDFSRFQSLSEFCK